MDSDRIHRFIAKGAGICAMTLLGQAAGCAQPGPIAAHRTTVGALKASVSQLEYDNVNLRKQIATLKTDSSRADNDLLQARDARDEMAARLDDAKDVIRRQGGDVTALNSSSAASTSVTSEDPDDIPPPVRSPLRRSRSSRKPPAAQIPQINDRSRPASGGEDPGPQAANFGDDGRWLPVARGNSRGSSVEIR